MSTENNNQHGEEREESPRSLPEPLRVLFLFGSAFFVTWGPGLQKINIGLNLSRIFAVFAGALIVYWLIIARRKFRAFPLPFNFFFVFIIIHTAVCYIFFHPGEFTYQSTGVSYTQAGYYLYSGTPGTTVARFFLFFLYAYALSSLLKNREELSSFSLLYGLGFVASVIFGGHRTIDAIQGFTRATGGFLNPNSLGIAGLVCCFLNLFVFLIPGIGPRRKALSPIFILAGAYGMMASVSRNTLVAFACGCIVITINLPLIKKVRWSIISVCLLVAASALLPGSIFKTVSKRVSVKAVTESNWSMRRELWSDYIREWDRYLFTGLGLGRSVEAVRETYTTDSHRPLIPHQMYLQILVEFGIIGLILFLAALYKLLDRGIHLASPHPDGIGNAVMLGLLTALVVYGLTGGILGERTVWLSLGCIAFVQTHLRGDHNSQIPSVRQSSKSDGENSRQLLI
jgi:O-antigen ligase